MSLPHDRRGRASRPTFALACVVVLAGLAVGANAAEDAPEVVRVLSFNIWQGGDGGKQPLDQTVEVIRRSEADVVGIQETAGIAADGGPSLDRGVEIAKKLGWNYLVQGHGDLGTGIVTRFELVEPTAAKWGAKLRMPSGRHIYAFNVHLRAAPYQPYHLLRIPPYDGDAPRLATEADTIRNAREARDADVSEMLADLRKVAANGFPVVLTGDFNEPSGLDWTEAAARAKIHPLKVEWPATKAVMDAGLVDTYRIVHPDPMTAPGLTWTPTTADDDPKDHHDRIDFVFVGGLENPAAAVKSARIVGESTERADVVVTPYPSDHRAVVAELELPAAGSVVPPAGRPR